MYKFEIRVGRLVECALASPLTMQEFEDFVTATRLAFLAQPGQVVVVCDMTRLGVLHEDVAERSLDLLRRDSPKIERGGYLLPQLRGRTSMQITRLFREVKSATRQVFHEKRLLRAWLVPVLTPSEVRSLDAFLADIPGGDGAP
jgi:hypothetical protein